MWRYRTNTLLTIQKSVIKGTLPFQPFVPKTGRKWSEFWALRHALGYFWPSFKFSAPPLQILPNLVIHATKIGDKKVVLLIHPPLPTYSPPQTWLSSMAIYPPPPSDARCVNSCRWKPTDRFLRDGANSGSWSGWNSSKRRVEERLDLDPLISENRLEVNYCDRHNDTRNFVITYRKKQFVTYFTPALDGVYYSFSLGFIVRRSEIFGVVRGRTESWFVIWVLADPI